MKYYIYANFRIEQIWSPFQTEICILITFFKVIILPSKMQLLKTPFLTWSHLKRAETGEDFLFLTNREYLLLKLFLKTRIFCTIITLTGLISSNMIYINFSIFEPVKFSKSILDDAEFKVNLLLLPKRIISLLTLWS